MTNEEKKAIKRFQYKYKRYNDDPIKFSDVYTTLDMHNLNLLLNLIDKLLKEIGQFKNEYVIPDYILENINELKRENNELKDLLEGHLYTKYLFYKELAGKYQGDCISKDKIRKEIEKCREDIDKMHPASDMVYMDYLEDKIKILEDLLEENNE